MCALPTLSGNPVPSIPSPSVIPSPARVERVQNGKRYPEIWRYTTLVTLTQNATKRQFAIVGAAHTISVYPTLVPLLPHNRAVPDTTGNIFGKNSGKKIGKKIGKAGKAARLLTLAFPETTTTRTPERINIHASHTTPAIPPATLPAKNRQHFRQHLRQKWQSRTASRASSAVAIPATAASPPKIETAAKTATSIPATLRPLSGHSPATTLAARPLSRARGGVAAGRDGGVHDRPLHRQHLRPDPPRSATSAPAPHIAQSRATNLSNLSSLSNPSAPTPNPNCRQKRQKNRQHFQQRDLLKNRGAYCLMTLPCTPSTVW